MRGLLQHLAPFAPDSSGVVSALYELGGLIVIHDAGGCTGNYCGFDEPRWKEKPCALFSAGLRDMDAILGRDDRLVEKAQAAAALIKPHFLAIVGTPVPCVIATDFQGLTRLAEKKLGIPTLSFATTGTALYDTGLSQAYSEAFARFGKEPCEISKTRLGILGASPLDLGETHARHLHANLQRAQHKDLEIISFGLDSGFEDLARVASCARHLVIAPSGLACAKLLEKRFGTPYSLDYPLSIGLQNLAKEATHFHRILIVHQQVLASSLRRQILEEAGKNTPEISIASFFQMTEELWQEGDQHLESEQDFSRLVEEGNFSCLLGDALLVRALSPKTRDRLHFLEIPHFAVSGTPMPLGLC